MVRKIKKRKGSARRTQRPTERRLPAVPSSTRDLSERPDRRHEFSISLCMIVKNESRLIADCLRSARGICKQLVVVDTGSDDDTAAIAAAEGAEVYHHPWPGHFSTARNISLEYATEDWILILDGDEVLHPDTLSSLSPDHLNRSEHPAVEFEIVNYLSDDATIGNAHLQQQIRLFKRTEFHRYQGLIHNQLVDIRNGSALSAGSASTAVPRQSYVGVSAAARMPSSTSTLCTTMRSNGTRNSARTCPRQSAGRRARGAALIMVAAFSSPTQ